MFKLLLIALILAFVAVVIATDDDNWCTTEGGDVSSITN